jgi:hypothetical protein
VKSYCKKFGKLSAIEIIDKFYEDEKYYLDIEKPHFEFIKDYFEDENFYIDLKKYVDFCKYEQEQKEKLNQPFLKAISQHIDLNAINPEIVNYLVDVEKRLQKLEAMLEKTI